MKYNNILLFTIPSTLHTGHFNQYFIENSNNLYLYIMPLSTQKLEIKLQHFQKGKKISEKKYFWYKGSNRLLRYIFLYVYYLVIVFGVLPRKTIVFATIPIFCFMSNLFDKVKSVKVVYHVGDYYHNPKGIMRIFNYLSRYYNRKLKYVIYPSPIIEKMYRLNKFKETKKDGNRNYWIFGIKKQSVTKKTEQNLLGYIGVLRQGQGVDIIFEALQKNKKLKLEIIGDGPLLLSLKEEAKKYGIASRVNFLGLINDENKILSIVNKWQIGLAPYDPRLSNMTFYAEPSKIKFYLEYRLPVIMTKITYMAKELEKYHGGICIDYNSSSIQKAIKKIQANYDYFVSGVDKLTNDYEYCALYDRQFKFLETIF